MDLDILYYHQDLLILVLRYLLEDLEVLDILEDLLHHFGYLEVLYILYFLCFLCFLGVLDLLGVLYRLELLEDHLHQYFLLNHLSQEHLLLFLKVLDYQ